MGVFHVVPRGEFAVCIISVHTEVTDALAHDHIALVLFVPEQGHDVLCIPFAVAARFDAGFIERVRDPLTAEAAVDVGVEDVSNHGCFLRYDFQFVFCSEAQAV